MKNQMLTIQLKDNEIEFTFTDLFTKNKIQSESFSIDHCEQIAFDILKIISTKRKKHRAQKNRNESSKRI
jgi:hypothetical protein